MFKNRQVVPVETIQDPNTGESVHRIAIEQKHIDEINKTIQAHQGNMNNFLMFSVGFFKGVQQGMDLIKKTDEADKAVKDKLTEITKKCNMDQKKPWQFNMALKCFEYRTAPIVSGMSASEIQKINEGGIAPNIKLNESVGA